MLVILSGLSLHAFMTWIVEKAGQSDWARLTNQYCEYVFQAVDRLNVEWGVPMDDDPSDTVLTS